MSTQSGWKWCRKCRGFLAPNPVRVLCPADNGLHDGSTSLPYVAVLGEDGPGQQGNWRWCRKCRQLFALQARDHPGSVPGGSSVARWLHEFELRGAFWGRRVRPAGRLALVPELPDDVLRIAPPTMAGYALRQQVDKPGGDGAATVMACSRPTTHRCCPAAPVPLDLIVVLTTVVPASTTPRCLARSALDNRGAGAGARSAAGCSRRIIPTAEVACARLIANPTMGAGAYTMPFFVGPGAPSKQTGWRWCRKCRGLFFFNSPSNRDGVCPADAQTHDGTTSLTYAMAIGDGGGVHDGTRHSLRHAPGDLDRLQSLPTADRQW